MQIQIEVLAVTGPTKIAKGRGYNVVELAYKDEGKVKGRKFVDFATDKAVYEAIVASKTGEVYDVTMEKEQGTDGKEYWVWKAYTKHIGATPEDRSSTVTTEGDVAQPSESTSGQRSGGRVTGSNYETPEERKLRRDFEALKHRQIGKQGCLNTALEFLSAQPKTKFTLEDLVQTAAKLESWVFEGKPVSLEGAVKAVTDMDDDIPF